MRKAIGASWSWDALFYDLMYYNDPVSFRHSNRGDDMRRTNITIKRVWIGDGSDVGWHDVLSSHPLQRAHTHIKIAFQVGHLSNRSETIKRVLRQLVQNGVIERFHIGAVASAPEVICRPAKDIVSRVHTSGKVDNGYVLGVRDEFRKSLGELAG